MDKNKRIALVIFFVIGIGLCTFSIYNSIVSMSQKEENTVSDSTSGKSSYTENSNKTGNPVIIDDDEDDDSDTDDKNIEESKDTSTSKNENKSETGKNSTQSNQESSTSNEKYITYTVGAKETLKDICNKYSDKCPAIVLSKAILTANNLASSKDLKEGMSIKIPEKYTKIGLKYTVKSGDSLSSIATKFMSDTDLMEAIQVLQTDNYLTSESIKVGDQLYVAASDATEVDSDLEDEESTSTMSTLTNRIGSLTEYVVTSDDSLTSISKKYDETCPSKSAANIILKVNGFTKSSEIKEGTKIKLPDKYLSDGSVYTVKAGDTLYDIVVQNMEDIDVNEGIEIVVEDNNIKDYVIVPGMNLFIANVKQN